MASGSVYVIQSNRLSSFLSKRLFFGTISRGCLSLLLSVGVGERVIAWTGRGQGSR